VDCYDPYVLENLFLYRDKPADEARFQHERHLKAQIEALLRADLVVCASQRQKDLFTGALMALNRLNPALFSVVNDNKFVAVVPFGIEEEEPPPRGSMRGKVQGYGLRDEVLIWGGGIWEWFDPVNLIEAVNELKSKRPNIRLHFLGIKHPNRHIPLSNKAKEAIRLAEELGIKDKHVFFGDWVAATERGKYLRDADLGVSFHLVGFETRYSFRTRLMDYLWAELPMVVSAGDDQSEEFASAGLGEILSDNSPKAIADAISRWLDKLKLQPGEFAGRFSQLKERYRWSRVAEPLKEFFIEPCSTKGVRGEGFFEANLGGLNPAGRPGMLSRIIYKIIHGGL
jgi:glycosyltransferase involved in cell wall biosynthesis